MGRGFVDKSRIENPHLTEVGKLLLNHTALCRITMNVLTHNFRHHGGFVNLLQLLAYDNLAA